MSQNLFGKTFRITFTALLSAVLLSVATFFYPALHHAVFALLVVAVFIASVRNLAFGVYCVFGELLIGSFGYLFSYPLHGFSISLRLGIFLAVFVAWLLQILRKKRSNFFSMRNSRWLLAWLGTVFIGVLLGVLYHHPLRTIFDDANSFFFLGMAPVFADALVKKGQVQKLLSMLAAGIAVIAVESVAILSLFSHRWQPIPQLYHWARNLRLFEITNLGAGFFRVFSPAQIWALFGLIIFVTLLLFQQGLSQRQKAEYSIMVFLSGLVIIIGQSRSFWLALVVTLLVQTIAWIRQRRPTFRKILQAIALSFVFLGAQLSFLLYAANAPYFFHQPGQRATLSFLEDRTSDTQETALLSRFDLLRPMLSAIAHHPFLGTGYGTSITFMTHDQRTHYLAGGIRTTYAFEWGYLDFWLKVGLAGLLVIIVACVAITKSAFRVARQSTDHANGIVLLGFAYALIALLVTHATTPFLNHPLGIGFVLLAYVLTTLVAKDSV